MKDTNSVKDNIINVTTEIIQQSTGDIKNITARAIAEKAGIGLGLINYHFKSKENLITICVQRIIEKVIAGFNIEKKYDSDKERLTAWAIYVFDFLYDNNAISRISILGDLQSYTASCNSVHTQKGFMMALTKDINDKDKPFLAFILTSAMQTAFLSGSVIKDTLGYDFKKKTDRATFIERLITVLFENNKVEVS